MANRLPHGAQALVDIRKLEDYCLNPRHPKGCHKALVFRDVLGLTRADAAWLREAILAAATVETAVPAGTGHWGDLWRLDFEITRQGRTVVVRTMWIVRTGENRPRFVSGWIKR